MASFDPPAHLLRRAAFRHKTRPRLRLGKMSTRVNANSSEECRAHSLICSYGFLTDAPTPSVGVDDFRPSARYDFLFPRSPRKPLAACLFQIIPSGQGRSSIGRSFPFGSFHLDCGRCFKSARRLTTPRVKVENYQPTLNACRISNSLKLSLRRSSTGRKTRPSSCGGCPRKSSKATATESLPAKKARRLSARGKAAEAVYHRKLNRELDDKSRKSPAQVRGFSCATSWRGATPDPHLPPAGFLPQGASETSVSDGRRGAWSDKQFVCAHQSATTSILVCFPAATRCSDFPAPSATSIFTSAAARAPARASFWKT